MHHTHLESKNSFPVADFILVAACVSCGFESLARALREVILELKLIGFTNGEHIDGSLHCSLSRPLTYLS